MPSGLTWVCDAKKTNKLHIFKIGEYHFKFDGESSQPAFLANGKYSDQYVGVYRTGNTHFHITCLEPLRSPIKLEQVPGMLRDTNAGMMNIIAQLMIQGDTAVRVIAVPDKGLG